MNIFEESKETSQKLVKSIAMSLVNAIANNDVVSANAAINALENCCPFFKGQNAGEYALLMIHKSELQEVEIRRKIALYGCQKNLAVLATDNHTDLKG